MRIDRKYLLVHSECRGTEASVSQAFLAEGPSRWQFQGRALAGSNLVALVPGQALTTSNLSGAREGKSQLRQLFLVARLRSAAAVEPLKSKGARQHDCQRRDQPLSQASALHHSNNGPIVPFVRAQEARMVMMALVRNWWMVAIRGGLAMLFGASILLWPNSTLSSIVLLFGVYAVLDGVWALSSAHRASQRLLDAWPVALEGAVSLALGLLALGWPFISRELIYLIAGWGIATGIFELLSARNLPSSTAGHWLLGTGGACSLFLAVLVLILPHATLRPVVLVLGNYALLFGALMLLAAFRFRHAHTVVRYRLAG